MKLFYLIAVPVAGTVVALGAWAPQMELGSGARRGLTEVTRSAALAPNIDEVRANPGTRKSRTDKVLEVRRKIALGASGTYISDVLFEHDSSIARWPSRIDKPLRIWIDPDPALDGWNPEFVKQVRTAFHAWGETKIPMRFLFVDDSSDAEVRIGWVDRFRQPISGKTRWARDSKWWIVDGDITIALHHNSGPRLSATAIHAIALHEVGHLLGLDHSADPSNIMTPRVRVKALSDADRATMRLLYSLPPGAVR
jgi:predicted Zn-dependent protease